MLSASRKLLFDCLYFRGSYSCSRSHKLFRRNSIHMILIIDYLCLGDLSVVYDHISYSWEFQMNICLIIDCLYLADLIVVRDHIYV